MITLFQASLAILSIKENELSACKDIEAIIMCLRDFTDPIWQDDDAFIEKWYLLNYL